VGVSRAWCKTTADAVYPNAVAVVPSADVGAQLLDYDQLQAMLSKAKVSSV
jgi:hypothetical protein